jgi:cation:H+ antiporter
MNMSLLPFLLFALGLIFIIKGGDWFIDSASWIAKITGMPEVLIGATIVSLGTTFPELIVSATSAIQGHTDMSIGNAIGSTICNIGLILGVCNLISPSKINSRVFNIKALIMVFYTVIFLFMSRDGIIGKSDSTILIICLLIYIFINYLEVNIKTSSKKLSSRHADKHKFITVTRSDLATNVLKFVLGSGLVVFGARLLVDYGVIIASMLKVPDILISLTAISLGTSLPELVTSISALLKGHRNLSVGNILGANILNISMVLGVSSGFVPLYVPTQTIKLDVPFSLLLMLILTIPSIFSWKITRAHAAVLLALYGLYLAILAHWFI